MKKIYKSFCMRTAYGVLASVVLSLSPASVSAQEDDGHEYVPVLGEGKVWNCVRTADASYAISCIFTAQGDTLIGDRTYKKVLRQDEPYYNDNDVHYYCAAREDEEARQVYIVKLGQEEEKLLYDFSRPTERIRLAYGEYDDMLFDRLPGYVPVNSPSEHQYVYDLYAGGSPYRQGRWFDGVGSVDHPFLYRFNNDIYVQTCKLADGTLVFDDDWLALPRPENHEYVPVVEEGKVWYCADGLDINEPDPCAINCIFTIEGDTLIGDRTYKKVLRQDEVYYNDNDVHYYCAVREDEEARHVYIVELEQEEEKLLYDFSQPFERIRLSYGDVEFDRAAGEVPGFWQPNEDNQYILWERQYMYDLFVPSTGYGSIWFDGVGSYRYPFHYGFPVFSDYKSHEDYLYVVTCKLADGTEVYNMDCLVFPTNAMRDVRQEHVSTSAIYDLQGRRLSSKPQRGLYIQNGKKYLIK